MRSFIPWSLVAVFGIAAVASYSELERVRSKYADLTRSTDFRKSEIEVQLRTTQSPIVIFGDSITAFSMLPNEICGHALVNAGIGGAQAFQLIDFARNVSKEHSPHLSIVAVGINDVRSNNQSFAADYSALLSVISGPKATVLITQARGVDPTPFNAVVIDLAAKVGAPAIDVKDIQPGPDGTHLAESGNRAWSQRLTDGIIQTLGCQ